LLREIAGKEDNLLPAEMLMKLRQMVILSLNQQGGKVDQADGMDMAIALINPKTLVMDFAGAYLTAIVVREGEINYDLASVNPRVTQSNGLSLIEFRGDKMPIGYHISGSTPFKNQTVKLQKGDMLYLFSDGYVDQFGGEKNIKYLLHNFRRLLFSVYNKEISLQKKIIINTIEEYKGDKKQVDDILVLGVRIE
jgi:serine phosphatase RsbU (regulator of sigma subunit)